MKKYWRSLEELDPNYKSDNEPDYEEIDKKNLLADLFENTAKGKATRRDFLKLCGFSFATAAVASACEQPIKKAIPYLIRPEQIVPGMADYYASTFFDGDEYSSIVVKCRDGRPIKIEGNDLGPVNKGRTSARVQASVLSLYDNARYQSPMLNGSPANWDSCDRQISDKLNEISSSGGKVVILTPTIISPSLKNSVDEFLKSFPGFQWIAYDTISASALLDVNEELFGLRVIPAYHFDKADTIVSFQADFLGTWLSPVEYTGDYTKRRKLSGDNKTLSRHYQVETSLSVTGTNADERIPIKPSQEKRILLNLYNKIATAGGNYIYPVPETNVKIDHIANDLIQSGGKSIVLSSTNDKEIQKIVAGINLLLNSYGNTITFNRSLLTRQGSDAEISGFINDIKDGNISGIIFYHVNPVYDLPESSLLSEKMADLELSVAVSTTKNETSALVQYICPDHHFLESWSDAEPVKGFFTLGQPVIRPMFNTRSFMESLQVWSNKEPVQPLDYIQNVWKNSILNDVALFKEEWAKTLQKGIHEKSGSGFGEPKLKKSLTGQSFNVSIQGEESTELSLYMNIQTCAGKTSNNPWMQEMPDPVSKTAWDNFASVSPRFASEKGWATGDIIKINGVEIPVLVQPGQAYGTFSVALGYGRQHTGKVADGTGSNFFPLVTMAGGYRHLHIPDIQFENTGKKYGFAFTQTHHSAEGRPVVREANMDEYIENPRAGNEQHFDFEEHHATLYPETKFESFHWGLVVDLNACTGCGACQVACMAENNIPVVGKEEVKNRRIMHWIRIDRYYSDDPENPKVIHQPVMCQHCDNAPCENVCPVSATNHSNEGLNQMSYNRCIGTKYCINNCPYRVRRFNWFRYVNNKEFDYNQNSDLGRMVLNPDVVVRERGVVEKCSFCVQRIQEKKLQAKLENRKLNDGEIQPACVQTCPGNALIFGDLSDPESRVSQLIKDERNYRLLEDLHTLPSVGYLTKIRNSIHSENKNM